MSFLKNILSILVLVISFGLSAYAQDYVTPKRAQPKVWEPSSNTWVNGNATGYAEGQTTAHFVKIDNSTKNDADELEVSAARKIDLCLDVEVPPPVNPEYPFRAFNTWNSSFTPTNFPDSSVIPAMSETNGLFSIINGTFNSIGLIALGAGSCDPTELGVEIVFTTSDIDFDTYIFFGGILTKEGDALPAGASAATVPTEKSSGYVNGTFKSRLALGAADKTINFSKVSLAPGILLEKTVTTATGTCGVDDSDSISVVNGSQVKFCFTISNTGGTDLLNLTLNDTTLSEDLTTVLVGLTDEDDDSSNDDLAVGAVATAELLYTTSGDITNTAIAAAGSTSSEDTSSVTIYECGDGDLNPGESCDDGNTTNGDGCNNLCALEACANNVVDAGETCDDGNTDNGDGCNSTCQTESCGNNVVDSGEGCDDGNNDDADGCSAICQVEECGNGVIDPAENCDDSNTTNGDGCSAYCLTEVCGNGTVDYNENCDDGNTVGDDGCSEFCRTEVCGNGITDPAEQCDDNNTLSGDGCSAVCQFEICGNTVVDSGEGCDDGNDLDNDGCNANCELESCGDGIQQPSEACDDGNDINNDGCSASCTLESCGDESVQTGEQCDDGNNDPADGCSPTCQVEECGNGILDPNETCDLGITNNDAGVCNLNCRTQVQDCKGVYGGSAKFDRCNVCAGDGQSCLGCTTTFNANGQLIMDGSALNLKRLILKAAAALQKANARKNKSFIKNVKSEAEALYLESWIATWTIPQNTTTCSSVFCVNSSNEDLIQTYSSNVNRLEGLVNKVVTKLRKVSGKKRAGTKFLTAASEYSSLGLLEASNLPKTSSVCN